MPVESDPETEQLNDGGADVVTTNNTEGIMAHYKRRKCRYHSNGRHHRGSETTFRVRLGLKPVPKDWRRIGIPIDEIWPRWLSNVYATAPAHWDRTYHTRPHRMRTKRMERQILMGLVDPDDAAWPIPNRPQIWYW